MNKPVQSRQQPRGVTKRLPAKKAPAKTPVKSVAKKAPAKKTPAKPARNPRAIPAPSAEKLNPLRLVGPIELTETQLLELAAALPGMLEQEVFDPALKAYQLRLAAVPLHEVAARTGYNSPEACSQAIVNHLQVAALQRGEAMAQFALQIELDRLDALAAAFHDRATGGDVDAAKILLSISAQRGKWQGFERNVAKSETRTIIITGGPEMAAQLEAAARESHPHLVITSPDATREP